MGNAPHMSTLCPPDVIQVIGVPRPSLFFALIHSVYCTEQKPKNKKWGRPGNGYSSSWPDDLIAV